MTEGNKSLFVTKRRFEGVHAIDQNHLNNGGHDEFMIVKLKLGYKKKSFKYSIVEYDIYGKLKSYILSEEEAIDKFGESVLDVFSKNIK